jgi:hypothetical protein
MQMLYMQVSWLLNTCVSAAYAKASIRDFPEDLIFSCLDLQMLKTTLSVRLKILPSLWPESNSCLPPCLPPIELDFVCVSILG